MNNADETRPLGFRPLPPIGVGNLRIVIDQIQNGALHQPETLAELEELQEILAPNRTTKEIRLNPISYSIIVHRPFFFDSAMLAAIARLAVEVQG